MATDYISREAAFESLEKIKSYLHQPYPEYSTMMFWEVEDFIDTLPAADVRPVVRGIWIRRNDDSCTASCSVCGKENHYAFCIMSLSEQSLVQQDMFCPNCGADMRPREEGNDG